MTSAYNVTAKSPSGTIIYAKEMDVIADSPVEVARKTVSRSLDESSDKYSLPKDAKVLKEEF